MFDIDYYQNLLAYYDILENVQAQISIYIRIGDVLLEDGLAKNAFQNYKQAISLAEQSNNKFWCARAQYKLAIALESENQYTDAIKNYREALHYFQQLKQTIHIKMIEQQLTNIRVIIGTEQYDEIVTVLKIDGESD